MSAKITDEELIKNLKEIYEKLGRTPKQKDLKMGPYSLNAYKRAFGTFSKALKKIDLKPNKQYNLPDQELLDDIKRVYDELGRTPEMKEFRKLTNTASDITIVGRFGTWNKALKLAGVPVARVNKVSKQEVQEALQIWYEKNDNDVRCLEYWTLRKARGRDEFPYSTATILRKSGQPSWEEAMKEYGFDDYETIDQFIKRGFFQGYDGNTYLSSIEKQVGDCLHMLKRQNKINSYEYEVPVCKNERWTCDFKVKLHSDKELWLEIDGMVGNRSNPYKSGGNEKIEYYKRNSFNFYIITYRDKNFCSKITSLVQPTSPTT